jgi:hypothetical protein
MTNSTIARRNLSKFLLDRAKGRFCSITFTKKDGTVRTITVQPHAVKTHLAANPSPSAKQAAETRKVKYPHLLPVYDIHAKTIKSINLDTVSRIKVDGIALHVA